MNLTEANAALTAATKAARAGREVLLHHFGRLKNIENKKQAGLVSEADRESEKVIFEVLRKNFPSDLYLGEESAYLNEEDFAPSKGSRWIVDPLDGTTNYIHRLPYFAISIGLEVRGEIQVGLIDMPVLGETYCAIRGQGAWKNGARLQVSSAKTLDTSLLATGFWREEPTVLKEQLNIFTGLVSRTRGIRRIGAAAYDLCLVAEGIFDGYWEKGLKPWDVAAGLLLVQEAQGSITNYRNGKYEIGSKTIVATNSHIHKELIAGITPHLIQ